VDFRSHRGRGVRSRRVVSVALVIRKGHRPSALRLRATASPKNSHTSPRKLAHKRRVNEALGYGSRATRSSKLPGT
jgi:hypothetical protein